MRRFLSCVAVLGGITACSDVQMLGATVIEKRRVMNDMQARATMAAVCDLSLGAYFRELNETERQLSGLVCGGIVPAPWAVAVRPSLQTPAQPLVASPLLTGEQGPL